MVITEKTPSVEKYEMFKYSAFAAELGWEPGKWPKEVNTRLGNGNKFALFNIERRNGVLLWVDYLQQHGAIWLRVYND